MYNPIKISEFLHRIKEPVTINPNKDYSLVTVKLHHKGVVLREKKKGGLLGSNMYRVSKGQFILSGIDARNGAFGIVPDELDGAIVTNDFWYFEVDEKKVKRDFFYWLTTTPLFLDACQKSSKGETQRIRLQGDLFFNFEFHFPPIDKQDSFLQNIRKFDINLTDLTKEQSDQFSHLSLLRQSILQEAIEGKLTAEWRKKNPVRKGDPDTDASALLERIKSEKLKMIAEGKIKKDKPLAPIKPEDVPFLLPEGWVWCRLGELINIKSGKRIHASDYRTSGVPFLRSGEIGTLGKGKNVNDPLYISNTKYNEIKNKFGVPKPGDILIACIGGSIGNTWVVDERFFYYKDGNLVLIESIVEIDTHFLLSYLKSPFFIKNTINTATDTSYNALTIIKLNDAKFPLPPLSEQHAIVQRVDSLLAMVDELEKQVSERKVLAEDLMQSVLREAFVK